MSIYSGFATRQQQETYDHCLNSLLYILQKRILKFYTNQKTDEYKFTSLVQKIFLQMRHMEKSKYLDPKCSYAFQQLFEFLIKQNHSDRHATVQQGSQNRDIIINDLNGKKTIDQRALDSPNHDQSHHEQKNYQIPIRMQKLSPDKKKAKNSNSTIQKLKKVVSAKSKQKNNPLPMQHSTNMIRKRTPSTSQGSRLIQKNIGPRVEKQFSIHKSRNMSFNQDSIKYKNPSKSTSRIRPQQLGSDLNLENQINQIIQGYMQKNKSKIQSRNQSRSKLYQTINGQKNYFTSK